MLAVISDIHANLPALEAVLADIDSKGIFNILCLGDIVGYNAQPNECLNLIRTRNIRTLLGNHDSYITTDKNCETSRTVAQIIDDHKSLISDENKAWLTRAESRIQIGADLFVHGGPSDPLNQYIYSVHRGLFQSDVLRLVVGHTHVQAVFDLDGKVFCNPGSVGQPRDGDPRAAYATVASNKIECYRVSYDISRTVAAMQARGYEPFKYEGLWNGTQIGGRIDEIICR